MNILSIGNSFSQDAQKWLHKLAAGNGVEMDTVNLYIGGCSLEQHRKNAVEHTEDYALEQNGESTGRSVSLSGALSLQQWDIVTLQQASHFSGMPQTYLPYLPELAALVREKQPQARLFFHQTWAYETDSDHEGFAAYHNDQGEMYRRLKDASEMAVKLIGAELIPTGTVIQTLRASLPEFRYREGGRSLCRDGFHLSLDYGRFAAAATWFCTFTCRAVLRCVFPSEEAFEIPLLEKIAAVAADVTGAGRRSEKGSSRL